MRGAPQSGLARAMVRTSSASSDPMRGRPVRPRRDFQVQNERKPFRCQRITVSGRTMWSASRHPAQRRESQTQKARSSDSNRGRVDRRRSRASCCLSARFSSATFLWVLTAARRAPSRGRGRDIAPTSLRANSPSSLAIEFWPTTAEKKQADNRRSREISRSMLAGA